MSKASSSSSPNQSSSSNSARSDFSYNSPFSRGLSDDDYNSDGRASSPARYPQDAPPSPYARNFESQHSGVYDPNDRETSSSLAAQDIRAGGAYGGSSCIEHSELGASKLDLPHSPPQSTVPYKVDVYGQVETTPPTSLLHYTGIHSPRYSTACVPRSEWNDGGSRHLSPDLTEDTRHPSHPSFQSDGVSAATNQLSYYCLTSRIPLQCGKPESVDFVKSLREAQTPRPCGRQTSDMGNTVVMVTVQEVAYE